MNIRCFRGRYSLLMIPGATSARLQRWYAQMGRALAAGIDLPSVIETSGGPPAKDRAALSAALRAGSPIDQVLDRAPRWLPATDRLLLSAAAQSGKLSEMCASLADEHADRTANARSLFLSTIYPVVILHFATVLLPIGWAVEFPEDGMPSIDLERYGAIFGLLLLLVWGGGASALVGMQLWPRGAERLLRWVPGIGRYLHHRALARFAATFDALLTAGVRYAEAVGGAALAVNDTRLRPALMQVLPEIQRGQPLGAMLPQIKPIPEHFAQLFATAERTGSIAATLPEIAKHYRGSAKTALRMAAFFYPKMLFLCVAVLVGLTLAQLYGHYLDFVLSLDQ